MNPEIFDKLKMLAEAAKFDVSCASSGISRNNPNKGIGSAAGWGICHSFTEDGRCVSLLKIMLTNYCIYDCGYCANRKSNDIPRTTFSVSELVQLTIEFYRRNYIEGLFLSSGIIRNADYTMERMVRVAKDLRMIHRYNGYIHLKSIPGASRELVAEAGLYADRLSCNIELPSEQSLKLIAPDKDYQSIYKPMHYIQQGFLQSKEEKRKYRHAPKFSPSGQSTQMIIGASLDDDNKILHLANAMYQRPAMKRVYYSGYIHINKYDSRLPAISAPPLVRENRLYQADWLMRFYHFTVDEIVNETHPNLDLDIDPKLSWALRNPGAFPIDINKADYELILRVPGIGTKSAQQIITSRKYGKLNSEHLRKIGVVMKRAKYFITCNELSMHYTVQEAKPEYIRKILTATNKKSINSTQLSIDFENNKLPILA